MYKFDTFERVWFTVTLILAGYFFKAMTPDWDTFFIGLSLFVMTWGPLYVAICIITRRMS